MRAGAQKYHSLGASYLYAYKLQSEEATILYSTHIRSTRDDTRRESYIQDVYKLTKGLVNLMHGRHLPDPKKHILLPDITKCQ